jgi:hypothetical protein
MKAQIRELLHTTPFRPFVIRTADGRECRIDHPDYVLASSSEVSQVIIEGQNGRAHFLFALLMTSVEQDALAA